MKNLWKKEEIDWLVANYPTRGKKYCCEYLGRSEGSVRKKSSCLKLKLDINSDFFKEFQLRAGKSKVGKKRPDQSERMKYWNKNGIINQDHLKSEEGRSNLSKRAKEWHINNEHPRGYLGHSHSKETKEKLSESSKKGWEEMTPEKLKNRSEKILQSKIKNGTLNPLKNSTNPYSRTKSGKREDLNNVFFRSKAEANYARFLKFSKVEFKYESKMFIFEGIRRGNVSYTPDFYIEKEDKYIEFKGWLDPGSVTKLKRFKKYFPQEFGKMAFVKQGLSKKDINILIEIGFNYNQIHDYKDIEKIARLILHWEY